MSQLSNGELLHQLLELFAVEAQERLQRINQQLLALEQQHSDAEELSQLLTEMLREAHSLKGAARAVNLESVETLAHRLEDLFGQMQRKELQPTPPLFDLIYDTLDTLDQMVRYATTGQDFMAQPSTAARANSETPVDSFQYESAEMPDVPASPPEVRLPSLITGTVRVATPKLDALMAQVGELHATRIGSEQRLVDLRDVLEQIEIWETHWRQVRPHFRWLLGRFERQTGPARNKSWRAMKPLLEFIQTNEVRWQQLHGLLAAFQQRLAADNRRLAQVATGLQAGVRQTRMLPMATVFNTLPRIVRDLARDQNKEVSLEIEGGQVEVDRWVLEQIKDPLVHLLRNSVDHGVEAPTGRQQAGKRQAGTIHLSAVPQGDTLLIELADDGAGIVPARVKAMAVKKGLLAPDAAAALSDQEALQLIFRSGFSTSPIITDLSGRGVGLDVVREHIDRLHGVIEVDSQPGEGTRFQLWIPL